jgi:hypothetical protein
MAHKWRIGYHSPGKFKMTVKTVHTDHFVDDDKSREHFKKHIPSGSRLSHIDYKGEHAVKEAMKTFKRHVTEAISLDVHYRDASPEEHDKHAKIAYDASIKAAAAKNRPVARKHWQDYEYHKKRAAEKRK